MTKADYDLVKEAAKDAVSSMSRRDFMDATKEGIKELVREHIQAFGWWSLKTLGVALIGAGILAILYFQGWHKP